MELSLLLAILRLDVAIAKAAARQIAKNTADLLTVLIGLPLLVLVARAWLKGLPSDHRDLIDYGASALIATVIAKALLERVWFHQSDGPLARFAQRPGDWLSYMVPLLSAGILLGFFGLAAVGILNPGGAALGTCAGVIGGLAFPFVRERVLHLWRDITSQRRLNLIRHRRAPIIGAIAAAVLGAIGAILPQGGNLDALWAGAYGFMVIVLTGRVDAATVRYMTLMGHSPASLLRHWLPAQIMFLLPFGAVLALAQNWLAAGLTAAVALGLLVLTTARIFAYRAFSRLIADWAVAGVIAAAGYVALTVPPLGAAILIAAIVWLARLGSGKRWMLA
ncbi:MAG: hypothetical protein NBV68_15280 [Erythrobacter sp.]|uniref:hypothetical protein n=1 Tax=Erythrobacter sp. TaxID=1042 RepID=UPI0025F4BA26|nr:hypothetical protein [Erythrobacter sp.]MCM0000739.1 hypothetical protein [Erythrobacter sp.]